MVSAKTLKIPAEEALVRELECRYSEYRGAIHLHSLQWQSEIDRKVCRNCYTHPGLAEQPGSLLDDTHKTPSA